MNLRPYFLVQPPAQPRAVFLDRRHELRVLELVAIHGAVRIGKLLDHHPERIDIGVIRAFVAFQRGNRKMPHDIHLIFAAVVLETCQNVLGAELLQGRRLVVRSAAPAADVEALGLLGFQCRLLPTAPLDLALSAPAPARVAPKIAVSSNAWVAEMISRIQQTNLTVALAELSGVQPVAAGGSYTNIRSRYQTSGAGIRA